jgi:hypothetical protein
MTGRIERRAGEHCSRLRLESSTRGRIWRLAQSAHVIFTRQDPRRWTEAGDSDLLPRVLGGAIILQRLGCPASGPFVLEDDGAHLAFITCCAIATIADSLEQESVNALLMTINLLAECCPVEILVRGLPPIEILPPAIHKHPDVSRAYKNFDGISHQPRDVSLADALLLLRIFQLANSNDFSEELEGLSRVTEGFRTALAAIRRASEV